MLQRPTVKSHYQISLPTTNNRPAFLLGAKLNQAGPLSQLTNRCNTRSITAVYIIYVHVESRGGESIRLSNEREIGFRWQTNKSPATEILRSFGVGGRCSYRCCCCYHHPCRILRVNRHDHGRMRHIDCLRSRNT